MADDKSIAFFELGCSACNKEGQVNAVLHATAFYMNLAFELDRSA